MSTTLTREQAIDRQELDDGDPDGTVYLASNKRSPNRIYHEDSECKSLKNRGLKLRELSREAAHRRWLGPCSLCVLEEEELCSL